ncbi:hypothetical protein AB0E75_24900 [Streptomyces griseoviridis]|jgi:ribosomal protein S1|uniref:Ribosomal protein S1 n=3 Tax=Streptomyces TaxID=1883 RepID=A0ABT9LM63_STRGD|nr:MULTISPECIES: hypothetical protein [Streptomyces]MDP9684628.1 ribosomal protein S1 [Streptomyces griseoviridis]GGS63864.1 hypothetical protein GCM10010238_61160 [Streptomyces niveoruber]GGT20993.1 hypothetical protein GCM10010240_62320 [Streptomyces griseoviridis]GGU61910.1 hypothetical protein GCM10010259_60730 [Streptomyces daghestanicus]GHI30416.1 hypothetical protein Sdagh_21460 [Streptomyces daghestanicus]
MESEEKYLTDAEKAVVGQTVEGAVEAVFRWGAIINLGLPHVGFVDALYIDDSDQYEVGRTLQVHVSSFDVRQNKFWLRPPGQTPVVDRLRAKGFDL